MNYETKWPDDAPEWANCVLVTKHYYIDVENACKIANSPNQYIIERPKPAKQKIDWNNLCRSLDPVVRNSDEFPTPWIAWNCDEHTRGNPLPDGLVVEWYIDKNYRYTGSPDSRVWESITRFRIVGIQEGWE